MQIICIEAQTEDRQTNELANGQTMTGVPVSGQTDNGEDVLRKTNEKTGRQAEQ